MVGVVQVADGVIIDRDGNGLEIIMLVISLLAIVLAPLAATLVQLAISRQREFLAGCIGVWS